MGYILALDQGGTKTAALVADETGRVLGAGYSGGAVHAIDGMDAAMARVTDAAGQALAQAGLAPGDVIRVAGGMTGADWPYEYPLLAAALRETTGVADVTVVNDCIIAFRAGTDRGCGAVLCAGTGLNAAVIPLAGEPYIYGYYIQGDENGGTALGKLAMRAVMNAESGLGAPTALTGRTLAHYGAATVDELLQRYVAGALGETKFLVPLLAEVVRAGDAVASKIVTDFGARLARYVVAGFRRKGLLGTDADVVLSGGVFKADLPGLREAIAAAVHAEAPRAVLVDAPYEPVLGALLLALDRDGSISLQSPSIVQSAERFGLFRPPAPAPERG